MTGMTRRTAIAGMGLAAMSLEARAQKASLPVRVGFVPVIGASALFVLNGAGWAKQAGLALTLTRFDSGPAAIQALASGTLDLLAIGIAPVAVAFSKKLDVRVVSAAGTGGSAFMASPALAEALAAAGNDRAKAFADLHKKLGEPVKLATLPPGAVPAVALKYWLFKTGHVAPADVDIVSLGIDAVQQAMLSHSVQGGTVLEPSATVVRAHDPAIKMIATASEMFPDIPGVVLASTSAFGNAHPKALESIVRLMIRATHLIKSNPEQAAPYVLAALGAGLVGNATMLRALKSPAVGFITDPKAIIAPTRAMLSYEVEIGDFPKAPRIGGLFDTDWWNKASAQK
ncbi:MAG TPA: ABC transporter substrate-binding protein [Beijerinckiaceae bacterium]|nr:ABC transporter substrate-binding protein [Beijerinckiaceae bacterium]